MGWTHLFYRQGWDVYWNAADGRMYAKENSTFGKTHHFRDRTRDRTSAISIAQAWLHRRS